MNGRAPPSAARLRERLRAAGSGAVRLEGALASEPLLLAQSGAREREPPDGPFDGGQLPALRPCVVEHRGMPTALAFTGEDAAGRWRLRHQLLAGPGARLLVGLAEAGVPRVAIDVAEPHAAVVPTGLDGDGDPRWLPHPRFGIRALHGPLPPEPLAALRDLLDGSGAVRAAYATEVVAGEQAGLLLALEPARETGAVEQLAGGEPARTVAARFGYAAAHLAVATDAELLEALRAVDEPIYSLGPRRR